MIVQYCSDLHLEFLQNSKFLKKYPLVPKGDILILGGDIVPFAIMDEYADFFNFVADNFETTYWVPGNHEYYHFDISGKSGKINEAIRSNIFLVNNQVIELEKLQLIFTTLWSDVPEENRLAIQFRMSDFSAIKNSDKLFTPQKYNELYQQCKIFLEDALSSTVNKPCMVVTHHVPTFLNYPEKYKRDILNVAFATELSTLIEKSNIDYWQYGHHHFNTPDFFIGKTKLITNQLGYIKFKENGGFKNDAIIEFL